MPLLRAAPSGNKRYVRLWPLAATLEFLQLCPHCEYVSVANAAHMVAVDRNDVFDNAGPESPPAADSTFGVNRDVPINYSVAARIRAISRPLLVPIGHVSFACPSSRGSTRQLATKSRTSDVRHAFL